MFERVILHQEENTRIQGSPARFLLLVPGIFFFMVGLLILLVPEILVIAISSFFMFIGLFLILGSIKSSRYKRDPFTQ